MRTNDRTGLMARGRRLTRTLGSVYASWRGVLVALIFVGAVLAPLVGSGITVRTVLLSSILGAIAVASAVLFGVELAQRDRSRSKAVEPRREGGARHDRFPADARILQPLHVVMVVHNVADVVTEWLELLIAQTWPRFRALVVDAGSTDRTVERAFEVVSRDPRFRLCVAASVEEDARFTSAVPHAIRLEVAGSPPFGRTFLEDRVRASGAEVLLDAPATHGPEPSPHVTVLQEAVPTPFLQEALSPGTVVLMPEAEYHLDELGPVADLLDQAGRPVAFLVSDRRLRHVRHRMRLQRQPLYFFPKNDPPTSGIGIAGALIAMNDWGECRPIIEAANRQGVMTYGKVEGVQDFEDLDVPTERDAYRTVRHVLCQGGNDVEALGDDTTIVGSTRLERIWTAPPTSPGADLAVINLNFTYGVLADVRERWLRSAVDACRAVGMPYVISLHPAEETVDDPRVTAQPMRHLLTKASVLISRFSTVPYEAMARGVPFIYHNPHGELVPTFKEPQDAFPISRDVRELQQALAETRDWMPGYRDRCERFFRAQVDIDPQRSPQQRTLEVVGRALAELGH